MKTSLISKTIVCFLSIYLSIYLSVDGQIRVNSSGKVGIGSTPSSSYALRTGNLYASGITSGNALTVGSNLTVGNYLYVNNGYYPGISFTPQHYYYLSMYPTSNNNGTLGIPDKAFYGIWSYNNGTISDFRQKENIRDLTGALDLVLKLRGVRYDLKKSIAYNDTLVKDEKIRSRLEEERKNKVGFIAQEVNEVIKEVVLHDDSTDIYAVDYTKIVPVLVEALKELNAKVEEQKQEISRLKNVENDGRLKITESSTDNLSGSDFSKTSLYQNSPNPFSESTRIEYYLADNIHRAYINVYNMNGSQVRSIPLNQKGNGSITIHGGELNAGIYVYTLIADGKAMDTKQMILTK